MANVKVPDPTAYSGTQALRAKALSMIAGRSPATIAKLLALDVNVVRFWVYGGDGKSRTGKRKYKTTDTHHDWWTWKARCWATNLAKIGPAPKSTEIRKWMLEHWDGGLACYYCGDELLSTTIQLDHATPHTRGGANDLSNFVLSCRPCNQAKGDLNAAEFSELLDLVWSWADDGKSILTRLRASTQIYSTRKWK